MPAAFDKCVADGGRVRTKSLSGNRFMRICFIGGKSFAGEVRTKQSEGGEEMIIHPSGHVEMTSDKGAEARYLEKGSEVVPNPEVQKRLAMMSDRRIQPYNDRLDTKRMERLQGDQITEMSSINAPDPNQLLIPKSGVTLLDMYLSGGDVIMECLIDGSVAQAGVNYNLSSRIQDDSAGVIDGKVTEAGVLKITEGSVQKIIE